MKKDFSQHQKEFYEKYWKQREKDGRLHIKNNMWVPKRIQVAVDMIVKNFDFNENKTIYVLDVGCGEGTMGKLLKEKLGEKISIIGCDISDTVLKEASSYYSDVFQVDIETDSFMERFHKYKFDYIVVLEVLEHLFKPENILNQCDLILKENGFLIASFPNIAWYRYRIDMLMGRFPKDYLLYPGEHIQHFTLHSFFKLLRKNGFFPIEVSGQFIFPKICKFARFLINIFNKFPNLFGYQVVVKSKKEKK